MNPTVLIAIHLFLSSAILLAACAASPAANSTAGNAAHRLNLLPHHTKPIIKIGLVAPFEGRYRSLGYQVLDAVKGIVRQRNEAGGVAGFMVELVALNDDDNAAASAFQARKFAVDADVMGVIGPFSEASLANAAAVYDEAGLSLIVPTTCSPQQGATVLCLGADDAALAAALVKQLPDGARPALLRAGSGSLGDALQPSAWRTVMGPWDEKELVFKLDKSRMRPPDLYWYDGDVLSAASLLIEMRTNGVDAPFWGGPSLARTQLPQIAGSAAQDACYAITAPLFADLPSPWAALAADAAQLLLNALEKNIAADGKPSRAGVLVQLRESLGPDGQPVFKDNARWKAGIDLYCYGTDPTYPGQKVP